MSNDAVPEEVLRGKAQDTVSDVCVQIALSDLPDLPSIIISGAPRCGKSLVAKRLKADLNMFHLRSDNVRNRLYLDLKRPERRWAATFVFQEILGTFPRGVIAEGTAFLDAAKSIPQWGQQTEANIQTFVIGTTSDYRAKYEGLLRFRNEKKCWTSNNLTDEQMLDFAKKLVRKSKEHKAYCVEHGFQYCEIDPTCFEASIEKAVQTIKSHLGV